MLGSFKGYYYLCCRIMKDNMRKTALYILMMMGLAIALPSCDKATSDSFPIMESFYSESMGLKSVSSDSVTRFKDKVDAFVSVNPQAKNHNKYKLIMANIKAVSIHFSIVIHDEWDGDTTITF